jgi:predicted nucleic acid-binding protein
MIVVADADAIIAFSDDTHNFHKRVRQMILRLAKGNIRPVFPITALAEATRHFQVEDKGEIAWAIIKNVESGLFPAKDIDIDILNKAIELFNPYGDPKDTFFDAIVAAIVKLQPEPAAVFGFDHGYKKMGVDLAEELIAQGLI